MCGVAVVAQTLVYRGRVVADHDTLTTLGVPSRGLLHLVKGKVCGHHYSEPRFHCITTHRFPYSSAPEVSVNVCTTVHVLQGCNIANCCVHPVWPTLLAALAAILCGRLPHCMQVNLDDVFSEASLRANCKYCHEAGARFSPRAKCGRCDSEAVVITTGSVDVKSGRNRWRDLLDVRVSCAACEDAHDAKNPVRGGVSYRIMSMRVWLCANACFRHAHTLPPSVNRAVAVEVGKHWLSVSRKGGRKGVPVQSAAIGRCHSSQVARAPGSF